MNSGCFIVVIANNIWMVVESRRIGISFVWSYVIAGFLIAASFAVPMFLAAREKRLSMVTSNKITNSKELSIGDIIGMVMLFLVAIGVGFFNLLNS